MHKNENMSILSCIQVQKPVSRQIIFYILKYKKEKKGKFK